jgi:hypothetical protein
MSQIGVVNTKAKRTFHLAKRAKAASRIENIVKQQDRRTGRRRPHLSLYGLSSILGGDRAKRCNRQKGRQHIPGANARIPAVHTHDGIWILRHTSDHLCMFSIMWDSLYGAYTRRVSSPMVSSFFAWEIRKYRTRHLPARRMRRDRQ